MVKCQQTNKQTNKQTTAIAAAADTGYNNNWHTELPIFNNRFRWCSLFWPCQP